MVLVTTGMALSTSANSESAELISGSYQIIGKGMLKVYARGSATGMFHTLSVNNVPVIQNLAIPFFGATGSLSKFDHLVCEQQVNGGWLSYKLRNSTGGALTTDYIIEWTPSK